MSLDRREFIGSMFALVERARFKQKLSPDDALKLTGNYIQPVLEYEDAPEPKPASLYNSAMAKVCWNPLRLELNNGFRYLTNPKGFRVRLYFSSYSPSSSSRITLAQSESVGSIVVVRRQTNEYVELEAFRSGGLPFPIEAFLDFHIMSLVTKPNGATAT